MDDTGLVRRRNSGRYLKHHGNCTSCFQGSFFCEDLSKGPSLQQFHDDVDIAFGGLSKVCYGDRVQMLQPARSLCFPLKTNSRRFVFHKTLVQYFDRDSAIDEHVSGPIDRSHSANAQSLIEPILLIESLAN